MLHWISAVCRTALSSLPPLLLLLVCVAGQVPQTHDCPADAAANPTFSVTVAPAPVLAEEGKQLEISCSYESCPKTTEFDLRWKKDSANVYVQSTYGDARNDMPVLGGIARNMQRSPNGVNLIIPVVEDGDQGEYCCDITPADIAASATRCTEVKYYDRGSGLQVKDHLGQSLTNSANYETLERDVSFTVSVSEATPEPAITVHKGDEDVLLQDGKLIIKDISGSVTYDIRLVFHGKVVETFQLPISYIGSGGNGLAIGLSVAAAVLVVLVAIGGVLGYKWRKDRHSL